MAALQANRILSGSLPRCGWMAPRSATASPTWPSRNCRSPSGPPTSNVWTASRRLSDGAAGRAAGADGAPPVHRPGFLQGIGSPERGGPAAGREALCPPTKSPHICPMKKRRPAPRPSGTSAVCPLPSGIPAPGRARPAVRLSRQPRPG